MQGSRKIIRGAGRTPPPPPPTLSPPSPASSFSPIQYLAFEPPLRADLISSVALTGTDHNKGEAVYLQVMRVSEPPTRIPSFQFQKTSKLAPADAHWASHRMPRVPIVWFIFIEQVDKGETLFLREVKPKPSTIIIPLIFPTNG
ncbi:hypothetical protein K438DRAFT_223019 [Mycena galopus ATCC 62051]|nr:hypothetical protein K438DRAFT_223019 [Mycena galopus ATCC 62051]